MFIEYAEDLTKIDEHYDVTDGGGELHITGGRGDMAVWLNTSVMDFDGLCVGCGESRKQAIEDAIATLEKALEVLKEKV